MLGVCLDCSNMEFFEPLLRSAYEQVCAACRKNGVPVPENHGEDCSRDCAVLNAAHSLCMPPFDSVLAPFTQGDPVYDGSALRNRSHIQICMKSLDRIFDPRLLPSEES